MKASELFRQLADSCERWDVDLPALVAPLAKMGVDRLKQAKTKEEFVSGLFSSLKGLAMSSGK
jgi:hypothetical protein